MLLPTLVILGLAIIPYFGINLDRAPLWPEGEPAAAGRRRLGAIATVVAGLTAVFLVTGAHPEWLLLGRCRKRLPVPLVYKSARRLRAQ